MAASLIHPSPDTEAAELMGEKNDIPKPASATPQSRRVKKKTPTDGIPDALITTICRRLAENKQVRRTLPGNGRLHIDRQLPFLCVYRRPPGAEDLGTDRLVKGEAAYLVMPDGARPGISKLVKEIARTLGEAFGAFLVLEVWAAPDEGRADNPAVPTVLPTFTIHAPKGSGLSRTVEELEKRLRKVRVLKQGVEVEVLRDGKSYPPSMRPLLAAADAKELNCSMLGLAIPPVFREADAKREYPLIMRALRRSVGLAMRYAFFQFSRLKTTHKPAHFHALGRQAVVKSVWDVDAQLARVSDSFDYLLQLTPVNSSSAFKQFRKDNFERAPEFHYRPQPIDPILLQRQLYNIPIERVEDPALQRLFAEKQAELDIKITMLRDRDTRRFLPESLQAFGGVSDSLLALAEKLLTSVSTGRKTAKSKHFNAEQFAARATEEFEFYRQECPEFKASARVAPDVTGLIVSRGKLLINEDLSLPPNRVEALLAHEVGTHLLTYYNGRLQPFRQLYSGLAGYEELQEGLAVLSEYLVGGLSHARLRQLAGRVVAVRHLTDGASFVETFRVLDRTYEFSQQQAYSITMRVYRGGGLTKDAVYLRGLRDVLRYVQKGGELEPLFVGKMAVEHIPIIAELQYRKVLTPAAVRPRYMRDPVALQRLQDLRGTTGSVMQLISEDTPRGAKQ